MRKLTVAHVTSCVCLDCDAESRNGRFATWSICSFPELNSLGSPASLSQTNIFIFGITKPARQPECCTLCCTSPLSKGHIITHLPSCTGVVQERFVHSTCPWSQSTRWGRGGPSTHRRRKHLRACRLANTNPRTQHIASPRQRAVRRVRAHSVEDAP